MSNPTSEGNVVPSSAEATTTEILTATKKPCQDAALSNLTSRPVMEANGWVFNVTDIEKCIFEPMFKATKAAVIEVNSDRIAIFRCLYRNNLNKMIVLVI